MNSPLLKIVPGQPWSSVSRTKLFYPFDVLKVGDMFDIPARVGERLRSAARKYCKRHEDEGVKFAVHTCGDGRVRCLRTH